MKLWYFTHWQDGETIEHGSYEGPAHAKLARERLARRINRQGVEAYLSEPYERLTPPKDDIVPFWCNVCGVESAGRAASYSHVRTQHPEKFAAYLTDIAAHRLAVQ